MVTPVSSSQQTQQTAAIRTVKSQRDTNAAQETRKPTQPRDTAVFSQAALDKAKELKEQGQANEKSESPAQETREGKTGPASFVQSGTGG